MCAEGYLFVCETVHICAHIPHNCTHALQIYLYTYATYIYTYFTCLCNIHAAISYCTHVCSLVTCEACRHIATCMYFAGHEAAHICTHTLLYVHMHNVSVHTYVRGDLFGHETAHVCIHTLHICAHVLHLCTRTRRGLPVWS